MPSTKEYKDFVLEQLNILENITYKLMMGEYLLYYNKTLFGGIYDDRLLIKMTPNNKKYNFKEIVPYPGAKSMYLVDIEDQDLLKKIVLDTFNDLKNRKKLGNLAKKQK